MANERRTGGRGSIFAAFGGVGGGARTPLDSPASTAAAAATTTTTTTTTAAASALLSKEPNRNESETARPPGRRGSIFGAFGGFGRREEEPETKPEEGAEETLAEEKTKEEEREREEEKLPVRATVGSLIRNQYGSSEDEEDDGKSVQTMSTIQIQRGMLGSMLDEQRHKGLFHTQRPALAQASDMQSVADMSVYSHRSTLDVAAPQRHFMMLDDTSVVSESFRVALTPEEHETKEKRPWRRESQLRRGSALGACSAAAELAVQQRHQHVRQNGLGVANMGTSVLGKSFMMRGMASFDDESVAESTVMPFRPGMALETYNEEDEEEEEDEIGFDGVWQSHQQAEPSKGAISLVQAAAELLRQNPELMEEDESQKSRNRFESTFGSFSAEANTSVKSKGQISQKTDKSAYGANISAKGITGASSKRSIDKSSTKRRNTDATTEESDSDPALAFKEKKASLVSLTTTETEESDVNDAFRDKSSKKKKKKKNKDDKEPSERENAAKTEIGIMSSLVKQMKTIENEKDNSGGFKKKKMMKNKKGGYDSNTDDDAKDPQWRDSSKKDKSKKGKKKKSGHESNTDDDDDDGYDAKNTSFQDRSKKKKKKAKKGGDESNTDDDDDDRWDTSLWDSPRLDKSKKKQKKKKKKRDGQESNTDDDMKGSSLRKSSRKNKSGHESSTDDDVKDISRRESRKKKTVGEEEPTSGAGRSPKRGRSKKPSKRGADRRSKSRTKDFSSDGRNKMDSEKKKKRKEKKNSSSAAEENHAFEIKPWDFGNSTEDAFNIGTEKAQPAFKIEQLNDVNPKVNRKISHASSGTYSSISSYSTSSGGSTTFTSEFSSGVSSFASSGTSTKRSAPGRGGNFGVGGVLNKLGMKKIDQHSQLEEDEDVNANLVNPNRKDRPRRRVSLGLSSAPKPKRGMSLSSDDELGMPQTGQWEPLNVQSDDDMVRAGRKNKPKPRPTRIRSASPGTMERPILRARSDSFSKKKGRDEAKPRKSKNDDEARKARKESAGISSKGDKTGSDLNRKQRKHRSKSRSPAVHGRKSIPKKTK